MSRSILIACLALSRCGGVVEPGAPGDCWVQSEQADDGTGRVTKGPAPSPDAKACDAPITCAAKLQQVCAGGQTFSSPCELLKAIALDGQPTETVAFKMGKCP